MLRGTDVRTTSSDPKGITGGFSNETTNRSWSRGDGRGYLIGRWHGSKLEVERDGPRGTTIIQTFSLDNRGRTLVIHTRREGGWSRPVAEFTSIYRRA